MLKSLFTCALAVSTVSFAQDFEGTKVFAEDKESAEDEEGSRQSGYKFSASAGGNIVDNKNVVGQTDGKTSLYTIDLKYRNLNVFLDLLYSVGDGSPRIEKFVTNYAPDRETKRKYESFIRGHSTTVKSKIDTAITSLRALSLKEVRQASNSDSFDFPQFRRKKTALFLRLPLGKSRRFKGLLSLFLSDLI